MLKQQAACMQIFGNLLQKYALSFILFLQVGPAGSYSMHMGASPMGQ